MARDVITIEPEDTIGHAAEKMTEHGVSAIVVSDYGRVLGIITERDLTRAVAGRVHSSEARVREWMTADPKTVSGSTDPVEAVQIMLDGGFRHLPVVEGDRAVGIVSIRDLAEWSVSAQAQPGSG
jgi:CBS domain-containing protein